MWAWEVKRELVVGFGVDVRDGAFEEWLEEAMMALRDWSYAVGVQGTVIMSSLTSHRVSSREIKPSNFEVAMFGLDS